ncbi:MAG TPA: hypothetical protein VLE23_04335, partial [Geminicoccaceae bacterium]|nr:hypothetical protein [Geminicoccaceae bacterium]
MKPIPRCRFRSDIFTCGLRAAGAPPFQGDAALLVDEGTVTGPASAFVEGERWLVVEVESASRDRILTGAESDRGTDGSAPTETGWIGTKGDRPDLWKAVHQALRGEASRATAAGTPLSLAILRIDHPDRLTNAAYSRLQKLLGEAARATQAGTDSDGLPWIYGAARFVSCFRIRSWPPRTTSSKRFAPA